MIVVIVLVNRFASSFSIDWFGQRDCVIFKRSHVFVWVNCVQLVVLLDFNQMPYPSDAKKEALGTIPQCQRDDSFGFLLILFQCCFGFDSATRLVGFGQRDCVIFKRSHVFVWIDCVE